MAADQPLSSGVGEDPTAVLVRRVIAWAIDVIVFGAFAAALVFALGRRHRSVSCKAVTHERAFTQCLEVGRDAFVVSGARFWFAMVLIAAWFVAVYGIAQGATGATPGKALAGVRVIGEDGAVIGTTRSLVRSLLWIADGFPFVLGPVVGGVAMVSTTGHRRLGDRSADSYVVTSSAVGAPIRFPEGD